MDGLKDTYQNLFKNTYKNTCFQKNFYFNFRYEFHEKMEPVIELIDFKEPKQLQTFSSSCYIFEIGMQNGEDKKSVFSELLWNIFFC